MKNNILHIWEFPKIGGTEADPRILWHLFSELPIKWAPNVGNTHLDPIVYLLQDGCSWEQTPSAWLRQRSQSVVSKELPMRPWFPFMGSFKGSFKGTQGNIRPHKACIRLSSECAIFWAVMSSKRPPTGPQYGPLLLLTGI